MTIKEYTEGNWCVDGYEIKTDLPNAGWGTGEISPLICEVYHRESCNDVDEMCEHKANARLIAAAPELLEALEQLEDSVMECIEKFPETKLILLENQFNALAIIKKAKGE